MARLPDTAKITLQRRVAVHHTQHWPRLDSLDVRWRGSYAYIDATTGDGEVWQLCRLTWNGHHDHWKFAIYLASRDGYEPNILPTGWPTGTPEEAIDCAGLLYLNDWTGTPEGLTRRCTRPLTSDPPHRTDAGAYGLECEPGNRSG